jgi:LPXTG-motif cell wall-anchored protein
MDTNTAAILALALMVLLVSGGFFVFRRRASVKINSPLGSVDFNASNDPPPTQPAIVVEDATSRGGGLLADDKTGRGVTAKKVDVQDDILISSETPQDKPDPKA